jgi:glycosyltransferase involved in cell wall biosynthesis
MTTTFYPPYHIGGDAVHVRILAEELVKKGHEVHIIHLLDSYYLKKKNSYRIC